jgi:cell division protein FtsQ
MKGNISVRKILQVFTTVVVSVGCIVAMVSASRVEDTYKLTGVAVHIKNAKKYHFIEQKEIMDLAIYNRHVDIANTPSSRIDINSMEQVIKADPWVEDAQVYIDNERLMHMYVTQRVPVARLFLQDGTSCYIDSSLSIMPLSASYTYYTIVVTNVPPLKKDSTSMALRKEIVTLARAVYADTFWNAQVSEIAIDSTGSSFEIMPVMGDHKIVFGNTDRMGEKFGNLFTFYKNVLNRIGWDKYDVLDVRYRGQVIASPSLPYNGPVDKAIESMNWISSMEETEAKKDADDSAALVQKNLKLAAENAKIRQTLAVKAAQRKAEEEKLAAAERKGKQKATSHGAHAAKKAIKAKPKVKAKAKANKKDNKQKQDKHAKPKYEYPEKKQK